MSRYMLLLYGPDGDEAERAWRWADLPAWNEVTDSLREAAMLVSNAALHPVETATSVRVRGGDVELSDGPFATTREVLARYYVVECPDLDEALAAAAWLPIAAHGTVEVRPIVEVPPVTASMRERRAG